MGSGGNGPQLASGGGCHRVDGGTGTRHSAEKEVPPLASEAGPWSRENDSERERQRDPETWGDTERPTDASYSRPFPVPRQGDKVQLPPRPPSLSLPGGVRQTAGAAPQRGIPGLHPWVYFGGEKGGDEPRGGPFSAGAARLIRAQGTAWGRTWQLQASIWHRCGHRGLIPGVDSVCALGVG